MLGVEEGDVLAAVVLGALEICEVAERFEHPCHQKGALVAPDVPVVLENEVLHAVPDELVAGREAKDPVAGEARLLCRQEALLGDGPDGDDVRVHVDAPVLPDERQSAGIRADVHPVLLLLRDHLRSGKGEM